MNRAKAQAEIRRLAEDRSNIKFTYHGRFRDPKNKKFPLSDRQVAQCLQNGLLKEDPYQDMKEANGWKFTMGRKGEESEIVVAGVLIPATKILVITGYENRLVLSRPPRPLPPDPGTDDDTDEDAGDGKK